MSQNVISTDKGELQVILYDIAEKFKSLQSSDCDVIFDEDRTDTQEIINIISDRIQKENNLAN